MSNPGPDDPDQAFTVVYDSDEGEVVVNDFGIKQAIEVRKSLVDQAVRYAAIIELEKLGYTVTEPGRPLTRDEYTMLELLRGMVPVCNRALRSVGENRDQIDEIDALIDRAREYIASIEEEQP